MKKNEYLYIKGGESSQAYLSNISVNSYYPPSSDHRNFSRSFNSMGQSAMQQSISGSNAI